VIFVIYLYLFVFLIYYCYSIFIKQIVNVKFIFRIDVVFDDQIVQFNSFDFF